LTSFRARAGLTGGAEVDEEVRLPRDGAGLLRAAVRPFSAAVSANQVHGVIVQCRRGPAPGVHGAPDAPAPVRATPNEKVTPNDMQSRYTVRAITYIVIAALRATYPA
jgi:hypothetical protein